MCVLTPGQRQRRNAHRSDNISLHCSMGELFPALYFNDAVLPFPWNALVGPWNVAIIRHLPIYTFVAIIVLYRKGSVVLLLHCAFILSCILSSCYRYGDWECRHFVVLLFSIFNDYNKIIVLAYKDSFLCFGKALTIHLLSTMVYVVHFKSLSKFSLQSKSC